MVLPARTREDYAKAKAKSCAEPGMCGEVVRGQSIGCEFPHGAVFVAGKASFWYCVEHIVVFFYCLFVDEETAEALKAFH